MHRTRFARLILLVARLALGGSQREEWNKPTRPFHIAANIYYVGAAGVSSFLITDPAGDVLLDGGLPETAPQITAHIAALGFSLKQVKYLLNSHAHYDHAGGLAELKRGSGAQLIASAGDAPTIQAGPSFPPVHVDRIIPDGGTVQLGQIRLTAHVTPGHTKGCTTWTMPVTEGGKTLDVMFYCSTSVVDRLVNNSAYPDISSDYEKTFAKLRTLRADIFLAPHPSQFRMDEKRGAGAFIDATELPRYIDQSEREFRAALANERKAAKLH